MPLLTALFYLPHYPTPPTRKCASKKATKPRRREIINSIYLPLAFSSRPCPPPSLYNPASTHDASETTEPCQPSPLSVSANRHAVQKNNNLQTRKAHTSKYHPTSPDHLPQYPTPQKKTPPQKQQNTDRVEQSRSHPALAHGPVDLPRYPSPSPTRPLSDDLHVLLLPLSPFPLPFAPRIPLPPPIASRPSSNSSP